MTNYPAQWDTAPTKAPLENGVVLRWRSMNKYDYVAIVVAGRVYTSSASDYVPKVLEVSQFVQWLNAQNQVTDVKIATQWQVVTKS